MKTYYIASILFGKELIDSEPKESQKEACDNLVAKCDKIKYDCRQHEKFGLLIRDIFDFSKVLITRLEATESQSMNLKPYNPVYPFEE